MKSKQYFTIFLIAVNISCSAQSVDIEKTIVVDGRERQYIVHLPPSFTSQKKLPVIFAFHGGGGDNKRIIRYYNLNGLADANGYIIVYPNAINKAWSLSGVSSRVRNIDNSVDDVHFISVLLDAMIRDYKVDDKHVFCTGISRGGVFSLYLAWQLSGRITAIAPVCASIPQGIATAYTFIHPIPVMLINGTGDPLIDYNGGPGTMNARNAQSEKANMLPTEVLVRKMVEIDHCSTTPAVINFQDTDPNDGCSATEYDYLGVDAKVAFIKVLHGGHAWPGGVQYLPVSIIGKACEDFNAEEKIFAFFKSVR